MISCANSGRAGRAANCGNISFVERLAVRCKGFDRSDDIVERARHAFERFEPARYTGGKDQ